MLRRVFGLMAAALGTASVASPMASATLTVAHTWSLANDWAVSPDAGTTAPANPFADKYGNAHVWGVGYGSSSYEHGPTMNSFTLGSTSDWSDGVEGASGVQGWGSGGAGGYPYVAKNTSGSNAFGIWPDGYVETHPAPNSSNPDRGVVEWTSPITGTITISASFVSMNSCSAGLDYSVDLKPSGGSLRHLAGGYFATEQAGSYSNPSVAVNTGDTYYFSVGDGNANSHLCDSTQLSVTITDQGSVGGSLAFHNSISGGSGANSLKSPEGVTMDGTGSNIVVADSGNNRIETFDQNGNFLNELDLNSTGTPFNDPRQAVPAPNNFIVSDSGNARLINMNANDASGASAFGTLPAGKSFGLPRGIATNSNQSFVAVADASKNAVYVFDGSGALQQTLTSGGTTGIALKGPEGVAYDQSGDLWVADTQNHRLVEYSPAGNEMTAIQDALGNSFYPTGIAIDPYSGHLWVADWQHGQVVEMSQSGVTLATITKGAGDPLSGPVTVAFDPITGDLYVADSGNNRIVRYTGAGAAPDVHTDGFVNTSTSDITVQGRVNPQGRPTQYLVRYGTGSDAASLNQATTAQGLDDQYQFPITDATDHTVKVDVPGLTAGLNYCFELIAFNSMGTSPGEVRCHNTTGPPTPVVTTSTPQSSDLGFDHIHMSGSVDPEGVSTSWYFQITPCPNFDYSSCPASEQHTSNLPGTAQQLPFTDNAPHPVDFTTPSILTPGATYYYRVAATNTAGQSAYGNVVKATLAKPAFGVSASYTTSSVQQFVAGSAPTFDAGGPGIPWSWSCSVSGQPYGSGVSHCTATITQPNLSKLTGPARLPTGCTGTTKCKYTVVVDGLDSWGDQVTATYSYYVSPPPPPPAQKQAAKQLQNQVVKQWKPSLLDWWFTKHKDFCKTAGSCNDSNALAIVWSNGAVTTPSGGQIIAAGSGNLYVNGTQLLQNSPALYELRDSHNVLTGIIAAGSGNIIAAGSGNIIAAGSGNIIAAGSGNIIAAGSGNIIAAGSGNIIAAGSGNFASGLQFNSSFYSNVNYAKIAPTLTSGSLTQTLTGSAGTQLIQNVSLISGLAGTTASVARAPKAVKLGGGSVTFAESGQKTSLLLSMTARGQKLLQLAKKKKRGVTLVIVDTYKPLGGKPITTRSTVRIKP